MVAATELFTTEEDVLHSASSVLLLGCLSTLYCLACSWRPWPSPLPSFPPKSVRRAFPRFPCFFAPPPPQFPSPAAVHVLSTLQLSSERSALRWHPVVPRCRHVQARRRSAPSLLQDCRCAVWPARPVHLPRLHCSTQVCLLFVAC